MALLVISLVSIAHSQGHSSQVLVGIMEDDRSELTNWKKGPSQNRVVRPLFEKRQDDWKSSTNHPEEIQWTIAFDGRNAGSIRSQPNPNKTPLNTDTHVPIPQPGQSLTLGKPSEDFSGWESTLFNRPLVLVSNGGFKDPDGWKPHELTKDQTKQVISAFRAEYPKVLNCNENEEPLPGPWPYNNTDIKTTKSYLSNKGDMLVGAFLEGGKCGINDGPFQLQLFLVKPDKSAAHLTVGSRKRRTDSDTDKLSLILVDAGDYDGDGKSEVVFFVTGYNEDGYAIFYDSFRKNVSMTWSNH
jgi:hypothetical protein